MSDDEQRADGTRVEALFDEVEARVLGALIEKARTTPDHYPLSLNALTNACNQKSNRDPVMALEPETVEAAVDRLRRKGLAMTALGPGSRVTKYKETMGAKLDLLDDEVAVLADLMLRGPQTMGELKTRSGRLDEEIRTADDVGNILRRLARRRTPMVRELPRLPGQKEPRWAELLTGEPDLEALEETAGTGRTAATIVTGDERIDALEAEVAELRDELDALRRQFELFRGEFE